MAELLILTALVGWWAGVLAVAGAIEAAAAAWRDPSRRCLSCGRVVWPWARQGWRHTAAGVLRWHGGRCRV